MIRSGTVDLMTTQEAATYLGLSVRTVRYYVAERRLATARTIGRTMMFSRSELDRFKALPRKGGRRKRPKD
jgi:excisionase family DNA binding protein